MLATSGRRFLRHRRGIAKAGETVRNIEGPWVKDQKVEVSDGNISEFRVDLKVTVLLD